MKRLVKVDDHYFHVYRCDRCGEVMEERPMHLDGQDICPECFGKWWNSLKEEQPAAGTTG